MLTTIFSKSLRNLMLPGLLKIFLLCIVIYGISWGALSVGISHLITSTLGLGRDEGIFVQFIGSMGGMMIAWFLFPLLYPVLIGFFDEKIAEIIEREDYPQLPVANPPFWPTLLNDAIFSLKAVCLNILFLPFWIIPPVGIIVYYLLNGYLLGTQFFRMAAGRRVSEAEAETLRKRAKKEILLGGIAIAFFATVPLLNLAAPLMGVAAMLHLFHSLKGNDKQQVIEARNIL